VPKSHFDFYSACREGVRPNDAGTLGVAANELDAPARTKIAWTEEEDEVLILIFIRQPQVKGSA
jgi:hypothetical protein